MMSSNRRKQSIPTKSVHNIDTDDKAGTSSSNIDNEANEVEYRETILRKGRGTGYLIKNFIYIKNREIHGKIFLRCQHRASCNAKAYIKLSNERAIITQAYHPHPPPNRRTLQFKTPRVTRKTRRVSAKRKNAPKKKTAAIVEKKVKEKATESDEENVKSETQSNDSESDVQPPVVPLVRERSQRTRKLPARLREDPSPITPPSNTKKRRKKKASFVSVPKKKKKIVKKVAQIPDSESDEDKSSDSSDSAKSESDTEEIGKIESNRTIRESFSRSPSKSPIRKNKSPPGKSPKSKSPKIRMGSPRRSTTTVSPTKKEPKSPLNNLFQDWSLVSDDDNEEDDDLLVSSDDEEEAVRKPAKVLNKREIKQLGTILDVDQLRKLSATALVLKFSRHTTSKVPRDETTFNYQHQYACTMLPGICSEKFCGNSIDTKPQIKRHLLRHIGELLTMTNQGRNPLVAPATTFPGSVQSQAKRRMPTTEEIEELEEDGFPEGIEDADNSQDVKPDHNWKKTKSYMVGSSHEPNQAITIDIPKDVNVRRSTFTVIRSAEGVNEVVLGPKGRLINLPSIHPGDKENENKDGEEGEGEDGKSSVDDRSNKDEDPEKALARARILERKKLYYTPYKRRKKGLSKTRAWHMRQSAVRLEIVDDYDEEIDIEDTRSDDDDENDDDHDVDDDVDDNDDVDDDDEDDENNDAADEEDNDDAQGEGSNGEEHLEREEQKIETEEVSLSGAFRSPAANPDSPGSHRSSAIPSTSQEIECDIIVRTKPRKSSSKKRRIWPRSVGQALKPAAQCTHVVDRPLPESNPESNPVGREGNPPDNVFFADPPFDDHNYAWHPTRYMSGYTFTNSRGELIDGPEIEPEPWKMTDLVEPVSNPLQSKPQPAEPRRCKTSGADKKPSKRARVTQGKGKAGGVGVQASNPRWVKVPARDKREPTDEEKKMKKKALELLNALHKKQPFKGRKGPFKCQLCGKNVTAAGTLRAHYRSHAGPFKCQLCSKNVTVTGTLRAHYRSHAGIKPYRCKLCGATFTRLHSLKYHMMIHNQQSRFVCDHCSREFRHASHFREHLRRHTGEEPFGCTDCVARFKTRNTYKRHLFAKHGKLLTADGIQLVGST